MQKDKTKTSPSQQAKSPRAGLVRLFLLGFLLAQLAPQLRISIHDEGGWKWPAFKLGYSADILRSQDDLRELEYQKGAAENWRGEAEELRYENERLNHYLKKCRK